MLKMVKLRRVLYSIQLYEFENVYIQLSARTNLEPNLKIWNEIHSDSGAIQISLVPNKALENKKFPCTYYIHPSSVTESKKRKREKSSNLHSSFFRARASLPQTSPLRRLASYYFRCSRLSRAKSNAIARPAIQRLSRPDARAWQFPATGRVYLVRPSVRRLDSV